MILNLDTPRVFVPILQPSRYKGAWGGRGSGKSHFYAELLIERCLMTPTRAVCVREVQKSLAQSVKQLLEDKIKHYGLESRFRLLNDRIETPNGGLIIFQGMQDHTATSIKSLEGFDIAWVEEAQSLSKKSLNLLRPTLRKPGSELWFSWNPDQDTDPVDLFLRGPNAPANAIVVRANWQDNPWLPQELRDEMELDRADADKFAHVWEGQYARAVEGAYYADNLAQATTEGRISFVAADPLMRKRASWDIGVNDSTTIWVAQWVGREIRFLDYIEGQGQPLAYYVNALRAAGHGDALCILPHDGAVRDKVTATRYEDHLRQAGMEVRTVANQGKGAALKRIEAARRLFPRMWFDDDKTRAGRKALAAYHERRDEKRNVGMGPEHDDASHAADAFGLMAVAYEEPDAAKAKPRAPRMGGSWQAA